MSFFKNDLRPHQMPKQVFLAHFEPAVASFGPPGWLKNAFFYDP